MFKYPVKDAVDGLKKVERLIISVENKNTRAVIQMHLDQAIEHLLDYEKLREKVRVLTEDVA